MKRWGIYSASVPLPHVSFTVEEEKGEVIGVLWKCGKEEHYERLAAYETVAYT
jgi:hypothetical protein